MHAILKDVAKRSLAYPRVSDAAVFGISADLYGERVATVTVRRNEFQVASADLTSDCRDRPTTFEIPDRIAFAPTSCRSVPRGRLTPAEVARRFR